MARKCRWHKCRAEFEPRTRAQLYCCTKCKQQRKQWNIARGTKLIEVLLVWHETRHRPEIMDHNTGKRMNAEQCRARYGDTHPALNENLEFSNITDMQRMIKELRDELESKA